MIGDGDQTFAKEGHHTHVPTLQGLAGVNRCLYSALSSVPQSSQVPPSPWSLHAQTKQQVHYTGEIMEDKSRSITSGAPRTPLRQPQYLQTRPYSPPFESGLAQRQLKSPLTCKSISGTSPYSTPVKATLSSSSLAQRPFSQPILTTPHKSLTTSPRNERPAADRSPLSFTAKTREVSLGWGLTDGLTSSTQSTSSSFSSALQPSRVFSGAKILADGEGASTLAGSKMTDRGERNRQPFTWGNDAVGLIIVTDGDKVHIVPNPLEEGNSSAKKIFEARKYYPPMPNELTGSSSPQVVVTYVASSRRTSGSKASPARVGVAKHSPERYQGSTRPCSSTSALFNDGYLFATNRQGDSLIGIQRDVEPHRDPYDAISMRNTPQKRVSEATNNERRTIHSPALTYHTTRKAFMTPPTLPTPVPKAESPFRLSSSSSLRFPAFPDLHMAFAQPTRSNEQTESILKTPPRKPPSHHGNEICAANTNATRQKSEAWATSFVAVGLSNGNIHLFYVKRNVENAECHNTHSGVEVTELPILSECKGDRITCLNIAEYVGKESGQAMQFPLENGFLEEVTPGTWDSAQTTILFAGTARGELLAFGLHVPVCSGHIPKPRLLLRKPVDGTSASFLGEQNELRAGYSEALDQKRVVFGLPLTAPSSTLQNNGPRAIPSEKSFVPPSCLSFTPQAKSLGGSPIRPFLRAGDPSPTLAFGPPPPLGVPSTPPRQTLAGVDGNNKRGTEESLTPIHSRVGSGCGQTGWKCTSPSHDSTTNGIALDRSPEGRPRPFSSPRLSPPPPLPSAQQTWPKVSEPRADINQLRVDSAESQSVNFDRETDRESSRSPPILSITPSPCGRFIAVASVENLLILENTLMSSDDVPFEHCPLFAKLRGPCDVKSAGAVAWLYSEVNPISMTMIAFAESAVDDVSKTNAGRGESNAADFPRASVLRVRTLKNNLVSESLDTGCEILSISTLSGTDVLKKIRHKKQDEVDSGLNHVDVALVIALGEALAPESVLSRKHRQSDRNRHRILAYGLSLRHDEAQMVFLSFFDTGPPALRGLEQGEESASNHPTTRFVSSSPALKHVAALTGGTDENLRLWTFAGVPPTSESVGGTCGLSKNQFAMEHVEPKSPLWNLNSMSELR